MKAPSLRLACFNRPGFRQDRGIVPAGLRCCGYCGYLTVRRPASGQTANLFDGYASRDLCFFCAIGMADLPRSLSLPELWGKK